MSSANLDLVRSILADWQRGDSSSFVALLDPDVVWDMSRSPFPEARVYHTPDGVREWLRGLDDAFDDIRYEFEEVADLGGGRVLVVIRVQAHGQFSKIGVDYRFAPVFTFRNDKIVRMDRYGDRDEAMRATSRG